MIKTIKTGGIASLVVAVIVIAIIGLIPISNYYGYSFSTPWFNNPIAKYAIPLLMIISQAIWFQRVTHRARFFDQWSSLPLVIYIAIICMLPNQLYHWETLAVNYIWLIFYQKLFYDNDEVVSNAQIFMDIGILMCIGAFVYPKSIYLLPFLYILLNQFTASDLSKFFIVLLSFTMVVFSTVGIGYFFISQDWVTQLPSQLNLSIDLQTFLNEGSLYTYVTLFVVLVVLMPVMYNQLSFMQTKNRNVVNMLLLQIICVVAIAFLSGIHMYTTMHLVALPLAFTLCFGLYHIKKRWLANLGVLFVLFALVLIQWQYIKS